MKISIEAAQLACPESKDETHLLPFPLFVPFAEFNPTDQCVVGGMSVRTEMLCDRKTRRIIVNASEMLTKTFPQSAPSLADVNGRTATAGDAVNQTRGQTSEGVCNRYVILWPQKIDKNAPGFPVAEHFSSNGHTADDVWTFVKILALPPTLITFIYVVTSATQPTNSF